MKQIELSFQKNIRDLGGLKGDKGKVIKYGSLFRGGALIRINLDDEKIVKSFNLTDVVDFRSEDEFLLRPDFYIEGVNYLNLPSLKKTMKEENQKYEDGNLLWFIQSGDDGFSHIYKTYAELIDSKEGQEAFRKFFALLQEDNKRVYFHCSQGKDRAGLAAYLIESALGVSEEDKMKDYLLSNKAMKIRLKHLVKSVENKPFYNDKYYQSLVDVFSAKEEYLNNAIRTMNEKYGGVMNFLTKVLNVDIDRIRSLYLVDEEVNEYDENSGT